MNKDIVTGNETGKRPGRPRKYESNTARVTAWREEKKRSGSRLDCLVSDAASWRIRALARSWDCSLSAAVERLIMETDSRYRDILFPETETPEEC